MRYIFLSLIMGLCILAACSADGEVTQEIDQVSVNPISLPAPKTVEDRFTVLALSCVQKEYPNKISHVMQSDDDVKMPRVLTPVFYGCFDWHSAVHGHWLLARILSLNPETEYREAILAALTTNITPANIAVEVEYYTAKGRTSFERPYGIAWYLQLVTELEEASDPDLLKLRPMLAPLEEKIVEQIKGWLPKLAYPIRLGTHNQSAFCFWVDA